MRFTKSFVLILGWMFEMSKGYDMPFIVAGIIYTLSGVIMYFVMLEKKCKCSNQSCANAFADHH